MRAIADDWTNQIGRLAAAIWRLSRPEELEVGLGATVWAGLVFVVVHFGRTI